VGWKKIEQKEKGESQNLKREDKTMKFFYDTVHKSKIGTQFSKITP